MAVAEDYVNIANRFGSVAERYCEIVDAAPTLEKDELLLRVYRILPELIVEAIRLPDTDPWHRNEPEDPNEPDDLGQDLTKPHVNLEMRQKAWRDMYALLQRKLGGSDLYWEVFDPVKENKAIQGSLADDIADIYQDLNDGLVQARGQAIETAVVIWEWREGFYNHWGKHAIDALRTLHALLGPKLTGLE